MSIHKLLIFSFTRNFPETASDLHQQIKDALDAAATFEDVVAKLNELATDGHIQSVAKKDGTPLYWR